MKTEMHYRCHKKGIYYLLLSYKMGMFKFRAS
jgi:hypothetical protein